MTGGINEQRLPEGWFISDAGTAARLQHELHTELPPGHPLHGLALRVVAHREGSDDILCHHADEPDRYTVVHLSWIMKREGDPRFPGIEADGDFAAFLAYERGFDGHNPKT